MRLKKHLKLDKF